jgi:hypothetical protein
VKTSARLQEHQKQKAAAAMPRMVVNATGAKGGGFTLVLSLIDR